MVAVEKVARYEYIPEVLGLLLQKPIANQPCLHGSLALTAAWEGNGSFGPDHVECHLGSQWYTADWTWGGPEESQKQNPNLTLHGCREI